MNFLILSLLLLLVFCAIAQPDVTIKPFSVSFKHFGYGLGTILIIIGIVTIHIETKKSTIIECINTITHSIAVSLDISDEDAAKVWNGTKTLQEVKPELFKDGDKCNHED